MRLMGIQLKKLCKEFADNNGVFILLYIQLLSKLGKNFALASFLPDSRLKIFLGLDSKHFAFGIVVEIVVEISCGKPLSEFDIAG